MKILLAEAYRCSSSVKNQLRELGDVFEVDYDLDRFRQLLPEADVVFVGLRYCLDESTLIAAKKLRIIVTPATGSNHIDTEACQKLGIEVLSLKGEREFLSEVSSTAELTWGLLMSLARGLPTAFTHAKTEIWNRDRFFGMELQEKTIGIIGFGRIGQKVASYAQAFNMKVLAYDCVSLDLPPSVCLRSLDNLLSESDIITLHLPLNKETAGFLGQNHLSLMKRGALLINTARGELVDEQAIERALAAGHLGGYACDVVCGEFSKSLNWTEESSLIQFARKNANVILTPHIGGVTYESVEKTNQFMVKKLARHLRRNL